MSPSSASSPLVEAYGPADFESWREQAIIPRLFEVRTDPDTFHASFDRVALGSALLLRYDTAATSFQRTAERAGRDGVDHVWVQLLRSGGLKARSGSLNTALAPGEGGFCDLGRPLEQTSQAGAGLVFVAPRSNFLQADLDDLHGAGLNGSRFTLLEDYFEGLVKAGPGAAGGDDDRAAEAIAAVLLACFRTTEGPWCDLARKPLGEVALKRATDFIARNLSLGDVDVASVAQAAGVSRSTLYRIAAPWGGVAALIWEERLQAARRALSDPATPGRIGQIASAHGFSSPAHFSTRFRERFGFSPRNLRPF